MRKLAAALETGGARAQLSVRTEQPEHMAVEERAKLHGRQHTVESVRLTTALPQPETLAQEFNVRSEQLARFVRTNDQDIYG